MLPSVGRSPKARDTYPEPLSESFAQSPFPFVVADTHWGTQTTL
jgi:hypothetical protein